MPIGPQVRRLFGPDEHQLAERYRRFFIDLDNLAQLMHEWVPEAKTILEVGCGEGAMTERIVRAYPSASVTAIDITPKAGRLYRGNPAAVTFRQETVEAAASREPASFDLVVLCDVIHHVPVDLRPSALSVIRRALATNGTLVFKDWAISSTPVHWLCNFSDRYLTGDDVTYYTTSSLEKMLTDSFGPGAIRQI